MTTKGLFDSGSWACVGIGSIDGVSLDVVVELFILGALSHTVLPGRLPAQIQSSRCTIDGLVPLQETNRTACIFGIENIEN